jgi:hypothetical protein
VSYHINRTLDTYGWNSGTMMVQLVPAMMAVVRAKEPPITVRAAIRVLKQHMVKEPIFEAPSFRTEEYPATAMGTTRD